MDLLETLGHRDLLPQPQVHTRPGAVPLQEAGTHSPGDLGTADSLQFLHGDCEPCKASRETTEASP